MPLQQRVHDQFQASLHTLADAVDLLSEPIAESVQMLTGCLMHEGKILCCGIGASSLTARYAASILTDRLDRDRPGLAAIALHGGAEHASVGDPGAPSLARQVAALGHAGDVLLAFATFGHTTAVLEAVQVAQSRDIRIIALVGGDGGALAGILGEPDVLICAPSDSPARIHETLLLATHCLCDGIDYLLLGA
jgi:D-sedoheptulose 7-phosphate isomerase